MITIKNNCPSNRYLTKDTIINAVLNCTQEVNYIDKTICGCGFTHNLLKPGGLTISDFNQEHRYGEIICITPNAPTVLEKFKTNKATDVYYKCNLISAQDNNCTVEEARVIYTTPDSAINILELLQKPRFIFIDEVHKFIDQGSFRQFCQLHRYKGQGHRIIGVTATFTNTFTPTVKITNLQETQEIRYYRRVTLKQGECAKQFLHSLHTSTKREMFVTNSTTLLINCLEILGTLGKTAKVIVGERIQNKIDRCNSDYANVIEDDISKADVILCSNAGVEGWDYHLGNLDIHIFNTSLRGKAQLGFNLEEIKQAAGRVRTQNAKVNVHIYLTTGTKSVEVPSEGTFTVAKDKGYLKLGQDELKSYLHEVYQPDTNYFNKPELVFNKERHTMFYKCNTILDKIQDFENVQLPDVTNLKTTRVNYLADNKYRLRTNDTLQTVKKLYSGRKDYLAYLGHLEEYLQTGKLVNINTGEVTFKSSSLQELKVDIDNILQSKLLIRRRSDKLEKQLQVLLKDKKITKRQFNGLTHDKTTVRELQQADWGDLQELIDLIIQIKARVKYNSDDVLQELFNLTYTKATPYRVYNLFTQLGGGFLKDLQKVLQKHGMKFYIKDCKTASMQCVQELAIQSDVSYKFLKQENFINTPNATYRKQAKVNWAKFTNSTNCKELNIPFVDFNLVKAFCRTIAPRLTNGLTWHLVYTKWEQNWYKLQNKIVSQNAQFIKNGAKDGIFFSRLHDCITVFDPFDLFKGKDPFEKKDYLKELFK